MGTSKNYEAPTTPQWREHKRKVTNEFDSGSISESAVKDLISNYISANGGAGSIASGRGVVGGGNVAKAISKRIANFAQLVSKSDLNSALIELGFSHLIGKSTSYFILSFSDLLCDESNTIDDIFVRYAISDLLNELLNGLETYEELKKILERTINDGELGKLLQKFFGFYIYHQFEAVHIERLERKKGEKITKSGMKNIKDTIIELVNLRTFKKDILNIDWLGSQGDEIAKEIMNDTFTIFER